VGRGVKHTEGHKDRLVVGTSELLPPNTCCRVFNDNMGIRIFILGFFDTASRIVLLDRVGASGC
jgi:hypothetical protein